MRPLQPEFPPHVTAVVRALPPDLKRSMKEALRALSLDPEVGEPLQRELEGLWRYRVRRFRIVYEIDRARRVLRVVAVGHRRNVYEEVAEVRRGEGREPAVLGAPPKRR